MVFEKPESTTTIPFWVAIATTALSQGPALNTAVRGLSRRTVMPISGLASAPAAADAPLAMRNAATQTEAKEK